jgi:leucyl aminopeptidase
MARLTLAPGNRSLETHFFIPDGSSAKGLPLPPAAARKLPASGCDSVWIDSGRGRTFVVHRYKTGPNALTALRSTVRRAAESMKRRNVTRARFVFTKDAARVARALLPHLELCDYEFSRYRKGTKHAGLSISLDAPGARISAADLSCASAVASSAAWIRDLGNTPANDLGSEELTSIVRSMARREKLYFRALTPAQIRREGMGGVLGVSAGSRRPPGFLILAHRPSRSRANVVLVGKGVTFDSGGISIKSAAGMGEMKFDMMGAVTALAIVRAARRLRLPVTVTALAPIAENVPSGTSYRPGDILRMRNGKTVEVDNTDAEGRLILADALSYAEKFRPDLLIDFATLTGAVLVALGQECAGVMSNNDRLAEELVAAGEKTGDRFWRLPLWDEYRELLHSEYADMKNTGGRYGGTVSAAIFLKEFVPEGVAWAHCDIAGVAHFEKARAGYPAGATGFGIAATIEFLRGRYGR